MKFTRRVMSCSLAGSLAFAAGLPLAAIAAEQQAQPQVAVAPGGMRLMLNGVPIHQAQGRISSPRLFTFHDSSALMIAWEEHTRAGAASFFAYSRDGRAINQINSTENMVRLRFATFDPIAGEPLIPEAVAAGAENELFLVQFVGTPLEEMRREVARLGGTVQRFLTDNTHVVRMAPGARARVAELPYIRWIGAYHPAYRLDTEVLASLQAGRGLDAARYSIECMEAGPAQQQALADEIARLGGIVEVMTPDQHRMEATLTQEQLIAVLQRNEVNYVDPWGGPGGTDMDIARQIGGAVPLLANANFLGQGVRGEIYDTEVQSNHPQWNGQVPLVHGTNGSSGFHGSACYGINFATGTGSAQATGLMPQREQGIFFWYTQSTQFSGSITRLSSNTAATDPNGPFRSVFQTSSVGSTQVSNYTTISAETDDYLFKVDYLSCQSQSNTGNTNSRPQAWAKNIVAVGGVNHQNTLTRADDINSGASFGPASDGRMKPELLHFYENIYTTNNTSGYTQFGGTSGATPITAGHFGLLHQMWHEANFPGFGGGSSVFHSRPKSTTARALMINTAYRYPLNQINRARQGWGMADLTKLYTDRFKFFIINADTPIEHGQVHTYGLNILGGEPEFRVTMVYPDPQGNPAAAQHRINDLSLKVTDPTGVVYWGNNGHMTSNYTPPGGAANTIDTAENVFIQNPVAGNWVVEVIASQIVQDGYLATPAIDAVYSLVASNATLGPPPPTGACCLPTAPCTVTSQATCTALGGTYNGDDSQCATAGCPPIGACCLQDGTCTYMTPAACAAANGLYRGDNSTCATANCVGACCLNDGTCTSIEVAACAAAGGTWFGLSSLCENQVCPTILFTHAPNNGLSGTGSGIFMDLTATNALSIPRIDYVASASAGTPTSVQIWTYNGPYLPQYGSQAGWALHETVSSTSAGSATNAPLNLTNPIVLGAGQQIAVYLVAQSGGIRYTGATGAQPNHSDSNLALYSAHARSSPWGGTIYTPRVFSGAIHYTLTGGQCYANCDGSTTAPVLNVADFTCFLTKFAAGCP
jgi:serine protease AprX